MKLEWQAKATQGFHSKPQTMVSSLPEFSYLGAGSGCSAVRLAHSLRVREAGGSNPPIPTLRFTAHLGHWVIASEGPG